MRNPSLAPWELHPPGWQEKRVRQHAATRLLGRPARQGSVLVVVVALSAMLLLLMTTFLARMRSDAAETAAVRDEAQVRLMLHAALMYLQETSRLGWSDKDREIGGGTGSSGFRETRSWNDQVAGENPSSSGMYEAVSGVSDRGGEAFGWTDVRNGWLGPLGPRDPATGAIPRPGWWSGYSPLPETCSGSQWPCPGTAVRCDVYRQARPRYAIVPMATTNPFEVLEGEGINPEGRGSAAPWSNIANNISFDSAWFGATRYWGTHENLLPPGMPQAKCMADPQPVASSWEAFQAGDATPVADSENRCWFRIYREQLFQHDGVIDASKPNDPYYDTIPISPRVSSTQHERKNWSVFVITCGVGPTRGLRRGQDDATISQLFPSPAIFDELRARERIVHFRVEWTGQMGGVYDPTSNLTGVNRKSKGGFSDFGWRTSYTVPVSYSNGAERGNWQMQADAVRMRYSSPNTFGGSFRWIQRLERAPVDW